MRTPMLKVLKLDQIWYISPYNNLRVLKTMNMRFLKRMFKLEMTTKAQQNGCPNQGNVNDKGFSGYMRRAQK